MNVNGTFTNSGTGTFTHNAANASSLVLRGATSQIDGTYTRGAGTVTMNGQAALGATQNLSGTALSPSATSGLNNLVIDNTSVFGVTLGSTVAVRGAGGASGALRLTNGIVSTGAFTLDVTTALCAAFSVTRTNGWVSGNLQKRIPAGASTCTFEVGGATTSTYTPIDATFFAAASAGNITGKSTNGDHGSIGTSGLDPSLTANRFWSLTSVPAQAAFNAVFNFIGGVGGDLDTDTAPLTLFVGRNISSGVWGTPVTGTLTGTSTQLTGLTLAANTLKEFVVGEAARAAGSGSFNAVQNPAACGTAGKIFTKLAGTGFGLDLVALNAARTALDTTFKGAVKVELLNASDNSGALNATTGCRSSWTTAIQTLGSTPQFLAADGGPSRISRLRKPMPGAMFACA